jgi:di/tricarboxylate transporter
MSIFQTWGIVNQSRNVDEVELLYMIPVMLIIIPAVYLIRAKVFNRLRGDDLKAFEEDLKKKRTLLDELKELFR